MFRLGLTAAMAAASLALSSALAAAQQSTEALQRRLTDAGCYHGAIDGRDNAALQAAIKACPSQEPVLLIESGMHLAPIKRLGVDRACRLAATGAWDKTVRVWSLPEGRLLRTLRVPVGPDDGGKIYATAVSPDGRWIAAGGWDAQWDAVSKDFVYIFDASSGDVVARIGLESVIFHLTFSPDGRWLAIASTGNVGLKVVDTQNWRIVAEDKAYQDDSYGAAFAPDGRLYTVAYDGKIRRYSGAPNFRKEREVSTKVSKQLYSVAIDPKGQLVAVGYSDSQAVEVYDAATLQRRFAAETKDLANDSGNLSKVAWSSDGTRLYAAGSYDAKFSGEWKSPLLTFDRDGKRVGDPIPLSDDAVMNLQVCGDAIAVAAADPAFGVVDRGGRVNPWKQGVASDMRDKVGDALTVGPNAKQVRFGLGDAGEDPYVFDIAQATINSAPDPI